MKFIIDIFSKPPEMLIGDIQRKKGHYSGLGDYYREKIEFLSKKSSDAHLLKLVSQDVPVEFRGKIDELGQDLYRKKCLQYYQKKMKAVNAELGKIDRIKIKQ